MAEKKSKYAVRVPKLSASDKTYDFSLSLPGMISAVGAGVLALTFFFVMGILIGRGYRPETDVPPLGNIMPTKEHGQVAAEPIKPEILKAEELEYPERLKASPEKMMDATTVETAEVSKTVSKPDVKRNEAKQDISPEKPTTSEPAQTKPGEPVYDYIYQVASFRKSEMADALSAKLVASGLKTDVAAGEAKGTTWYRVQVHHHGTPASTTEMKAVLAKQGIGKPLLKKKTASQ